jgi:ribosomal protein S18 acetylase RimI-like enzyme
MIMPDGSDHKNHTCLAILFGRHRMNLQRIEEALLNAWPALQQILYDGWILRFSEGYTRRANSVNAVYESRLDVDLKVAACEKIYAEKGLPVIFRLTPFSSPPWLDQVLEKHHYQRQAPSSMFYLDLATSQPEPVQAGQWRAEPLDDWLALHSRWTQIPPARQETHRRIVQTIPNRKLPAVWLVSGEPVACGLGVLDDDYFGLFDIVTASQHRNQGYGRQLTFSLLEWGRKNGARHAYLLVMLDNAPARHLYARLGFEEAYQYWYRIAG